MWCESCEQRPGMFWVALGPRTGSASVTPAIGAYPGGSQADPGFVVCWDCLKVIRLADHIWVEVIQLSA